MIDRADTLPPMDRPWEHVGRSRFGELHTEAAEAIAYSANTLKAVRERYRQAYREELIRLQALRDRLGVSEGASGPAAAPDAGSPDAGSREAGSPRAVREQVDRSREELRSHESELARLDLALRNLEATWLFIERGDASLVSDDAPVTGLGLQMRIVEAQEAERARLAQDVHDGPAQALSNAIFQVEFIEGIVESEPGTARAELGVLGRLLRRELDDVRGFVGQLRHPLLAELGLDGSIMDTVTTHAALSGLRIATDLRAPADGIAEVAQMVVLRVLQEALQNVRKHAGAGDVVVASVLDNDAWVLEVRDDGRGFDVGAVAARGRRNFGLQFMRERAELIGAQLEVRSQPDAGTVVRLAIPLTRKESG